MKTRKVDADQTKTARFELRLTPDERDSFIALEKKLGINRSDIVRIRVLRETVPLVADAGKILELLDSTGSEMGRAGNNINQLARHANVLNKRAMLGPLVISEFNDLFSQYILLQRKLDREIRQLLRLMR